MSLLSPSDTFIPHNEMFFNFVLFVCLGLAFAEHGGLYFNHYFKILLQDRIRV